MLNKETHAKMLKLVLVQTHDYMPEHKLINELYFPFEVVA